MSSEEVAPPCDAHTQTQASGTDLGIQTVFVTEETGTQVSIQSVGIGVQFAPVYQNVLINATVVSAEIGVQVGAETSTVATQYEYEELGCDAETQTEVVGPLARWLRIYRLSRRLSFLRRVRAALTVYVQDFDQLWARTV